MDIQTQFSKTSYSANLANKLQLVLFAFLIMFSLNGYGASNSVTPNEAEMMRNNLAVMVEWFLRVGSFVMLGMQSFFYLVWAASKGGVHVINLPCSFGAVQRLRYLSIHPLHFSSKLHHYLTIQTRHPIAVILGGLMLSWQPVAIAATEQLVFRDDFNTLNNDLWTITRSGGDGKSTIPDNTAVNVNNGAIRILADRTDDVAVVHSQPIKIEPNKKIKIKWRNYIHPANRYFTGGLFLYESTQNLEKDILNEAEGSTIMCYVHHFDFTYQGDWNIFFLSNMDDPNNKDAKVTPAWNQWVEEELIYDPTTGTANYSVNGETTTSKCSIPKANNAYLRLRIHSYGWWTGHYTDMDYIEVSNIDNSTVSNPGNSTSSNTTNPVAIDNSKNASQVLIYPYYTVNNGFETSYTLSNQATDYKAVKIRFRDAKLGFDALDFNAYLKPSETFKFMLKANANGNAAFFSNTATCTYPTIPSQGVLFPDFYTNRTLTEAREGYLEAIEMGNVASEKIRAQLSQGNCQIIRSSWDAGQFTQGGAESSNGYYGDTVPTGINPPTGGLQGSATLSNAVTSENYAITPVGIKNYSNKAQHYRADDSEFYLLPSLASGSNTTSINVDGIQKTWSKTSDYGFNNPDMLPPINPVATGINPYPVAHALSSQQLAIDYPGNNTITDWITTLPMRPFNVFNAGKYSLTNSQGTPIISNTITLDRSVGVLTFNNKTVLSYNKALNLGLNELVDGQLNLLPQTYYELAPVISAKVVKTIASSASKPVPAISTPTKNPTDCSGATPVFLATTGIACLPVVEVPSIFGASHYYNVELKLTSVTTSINFAVQKASEISASGSGHPNFSGTTGLLTIPSIDVPATSGTEKFRAKLALQPNSNPFAFTLTEATLLSSTVTPSTPTPAPNPVAGNCGSANGNSFSTVPSSNLCSTGSATSVSKNGSQWLWSCNGTNGGLADSCSAEVKTEPVANRRPSITAAKVIFTNPYYPGRIDPYAPHAVYTAVDPDGDQISTKVYIHAGEDRARYLGSLTDSIISASGASVTTDKIGVDLSGNYKIVWMEIRPGDQGGWGESAWIKFDVTDKSKESISLDGSTASAPTPTPTTVPVNGTCGTATHQAATALAPTTNLCTTGTQTTPNPSGNLWVWSCNGSNNGTSISCEAPRQTTTSSICNPSIDKC